MFHVVLECPVLHVCALRKEAVTVSGGGLRKAECGVPEIVVHVYKFHVLELNLGIMLDTFSPFKAFGIYWRYFSLSSFYYVKSKYLKSL